MQKNFTIEWREITKQTYDTIKPTFELLQPIFGAALLPVIREDTYATNPQLHEKEVNAKVTATLRSVWNSKLQKLQNDLQSDRIPVAYLAVAKDTQEEALGFALFEEEPMKDNLKSRMLDDGQLESIEEFFSNDGVSDEIYVSALMVRPANQKGQGIGRACVFSVLAHCLRIKKIYLTTSAGCSNKGTQTFYEHVGFKNLFTGEFSELD